MPICNQQKKRQYRPPADFFSAFEVSRPYHAKSFWEIGRFDSAFFQEIILSFGVFRRETASGFYPWRNVDGPRERVAEGLCG